jgi:hypothetical protein
VGIDDDFFELGGNSLLGASLFAQLSEEFGQPISLGRLFEAPTVRKLAEYLRSSLPLDGCVSLVAIVPRSSRAPVFAIGGVGGNVLGFADLARALGREQGFYAFQSVGIDGAREPLESIEAMAQLYLSEMRSVQPHGPSRWWRPLRATVAYDGAAPYRKRRRGSSSACSTLMSWRRGCGSSRRAFQRRAPSGKDDWPRFFASRLQPLPPPVARAQPARACRLRRRQAAHVVAQTSGRASRACASR